MNMNATAGLLHGCRGRSVAIRRFIIRILLFVVMSSQSCLSSIYKYIQSSTNNSTMLVPLNSHSHRSSAELSGVILTIGKDTRVFEKSIVSSLKHLVDVHTYYVITPNAKQLHDKLSKVLGPRVVFIDEGIFPFGMMNVSEVMIETVREKGVYELTGKTPFEHTVWGRGGWFLQQLLKFYAGRVLSIGDYVLLDSDIVWFRNVSFVNATDVDGVPTRYNYATSNQYHGPYVATLKRISGLDLFKGKDVHRSGIVHHMVIMQRVLDDLIRRSDAMHGIEFWRVLLNQSAVELTCRAPRQGICGAGSTLSEYELYFSYAQHRFPDTVQLRPLMWANGPAPGLQYWPQLDDQPGPKTDGPKNHWLGHRQSEVPRIFDLQMKADGLQGYDYVAYHGYGKRRYFELVDPDINALCEGKALGVANTTCSWRGYEDDPPLRRLHPAKQWFDGCACFMANHQSGP